jgi:hypothetical protein
MRLVGGTSLALQIGHRKSIDIDLFGELVEDEYELSAQLEELGNVKILNKTAKTLICVINDIKVDIVNFRYDWLSDPLITDKIILADTKDIAAMKLSAITGRGSKKDFIDIYYLLQTYSLKQMISFYNEKFKDGSEFLVLKSLSYFYDADKEPNPVMLHKISWKKIKSTVLDHLNEYLKKIND